MTGLLITLACLLLIGCIPVGIRAVYDSGLTLHFTVLGIRFRMYPSRPKKEKQPKKAKKPKEKKKRRVKNG